MDVKREYAVAFELASTGRYGEARSKLLEILQHRPAYIDALVLLGKVEYYLKLYRDSKKRFETVLTYEPGNFAAYFGLEYYRERVRKAGFYLLMIVIFIFFFAAAGFLYFSLSASFAEKVAVLEQTITRQSVQLDGLKETVSKTGRQRYKELLKKLAEMSKQVNRDMETFSSLLERIDRSIKMLQAEISALGREQKKILEHLKNE